MAKSDKPGTSFNLGVMHGRVSLLKHYMGNVQSLLATFQLEAHAYFDVDEEAFILHLVKLGTVQIEASHKALASLEARLVSEISTQREGV